MAEVLNGMVTFLCCVTLTRRWHFCFIKQLLVESFGLRLYKTKKNAPLGKLFLNYITSFSFKMAMRTTS